MATFEFDFSEEFLVEAFRRYYRCQPLARFSGIVKGVLSVIVLVPTIASLMMQEFLLAAFLISLVVMLLFSQRYTEWRIQRGFRKSPYYHDHCQTQLASTGFSSKGTTSSTHLSWTVFTSARRFDDGFLLFQGPRVFNWLPCSALTSGTEDEVDDLISLNVADYKRV